MARTPMPKPGQILHLTRWQATRQAVALAANMKCECCGVLAFLRGRGAGEADHIIPRRELSQNGGDPFDMENLQWLCQPCHAAKSARERWGDHQAKPKKNRLKSRTKIVGRKKFLLAAGLSTADIIR